MWHVCCCFFSLYVVFQQDPGCWRSRVRVMPCCSIFSGIRRFSFQPRTQWPPRSPPLHPLLLLSLLFHTLRWTSFFSSLWQNLLRHWLHSMAFFNFYNLLVLITSMWQQVISSQHLPTNGTILSVGTPLYQSLNSCTIYKESVKSL